MNDTILDKACRDFLWNEAPVLVLVLDAENHVIEANAHARKTLGESVVGRALAELAVDFDGTLSPQELARERRVQLVHVASARGALGTYQILCVDLGDSTLILGVIDGADLAFVQQEIVALNNELGNLTRELSRKNAELSRLNEIKNRFLGMAAHDLRKPVGAMLTYTEFLIDEAGPRLDEEQRRFLGIIRSSCDFMARLIDDFLDVAVIESGQLIIHRAPVDPATIVAASMAVADIHARRKGVVCQVDAPPQPPTQVDAAKMEQVLNNLVINAIEHSKPGDAVTVCSSVIGNEWVVTVKDRGAGIDPSDLARLFNAFERGRVPKTAGERSTGLGLAIAKKIVDGHGGNIQAESAPAAGTTFTVRIPVTKGAKT
jgi:signal transduction histidine kinase